MNASPISDHELEGIFAPLAGYGSWALAVSGGADSTALMHLAARWRDIAAAKVKITVLTVDHGLRAEAAREADHVARIAAALGLAQETLPWQGIKPTTGIQAAAREARYDLMTRHAHAHAIDCLATAHHLDDQAETIVMRLKRGSGPDGLSGIAQTSYWAGVPLIRPLLDIAGARLRATLIAAGIDWVEDPGNSDERFERVRVRKAMAALEQAGLAAGDFALTARRMRRARAALDGATQDFLRRCARLADEGYCALDRAGFAAVPEEIALRALGRSLEAVSGVPSPLSLAKLEALTQGLRDGEERARTLAGCKVTMRKHEILVVREAGRRGLGEVELHPGEQVLWDRRFTVAASTRASSPVTVKALGDKGFSEVRARLRRPVGLPADAAHTLASIWRGTRLVAVPLLGFDVSATGPGATKGSGNSYTARFVNTHSFRHAQVEVST
ncbi:MAG: tRNA lysidine(34) synthetase TilS [Hyphomicrobiales bacterium]|nr:tRNA lysidine(34) synthetase TilS [Hyphomicrobiales bacterium]